MSIYIENIHESTSLFDMVGLLEGEYRGLLDGGSVGPLARAEDVWRCLACPTEIELE